MLSMCLVWSRYTCYFSICCCCWYHCCLIYMLPQHADVSLMRKSWTFTWQLRVLLQDLRTD